MSQTAPVSPDAVKSAAQKLFKMNQRLARHRVQSNIVGLIGDRHERAIEVQEQGKPLGVAERWQGHAGQNEVSLQIQHKDFHGIG